MRNFTPHEINIIDVNSIMYNSKIRKYVPDEREWLQCLLCNIDWVWEPDKSSTQFCPQCGQIHFGAGTKDSGYVKVLKIVASLPSAGLLSAKIETAQGPVIDDIPTFNKIVTGCDLLPTGDDKLIVSAIYAVAARQCGFDMSRIMVVADPVVTPDDTKILGCIGVGPAM